jgi:Fur family ferric uptake transcriptional regulator
MKATNKKENVRQTVERILDNYLEMNNHRKTPERYAILQAVYSMGDHFTLDELGEKLSNDYKFPVSRATLYNTLNLFMELRLVIRHRFQGSTKYEAC